MLTEEFGGYFPTMISIADLVCILAEFGAPETVNDGTPGVFRVLMVVSLVLIWLVGLRRSTAARTRFKRRRTRVDMLSIERATYLYMTRL